jgi:hypothetical protein
MRTDRDAFRRLGLAAVLLFFAAVAALSEPTVGAGAPYGGCALGWRLDR